MQNNVEPAAGLRLDQIAVDTDAEDNGQWFESAEYEGVSVKVAGINSPNFRARFAFLLKGMRKLPKKKQQEEENRLFSQAFAETCVKDWSGILDAGNRPLGFSTEMAVEILCDRRYHVFAAELIEFSKLVGRVRDEADEELLGKSEAESGSGSASASSRKANGRSSGGDKKTGSRSSSSTSQSTLPTL
jgi:hypothetical protein